VQRDRFTEHLAASVMRRGELLSLQWRDVNLDRRELTVRAENTKTRTHRVLPVSSRLAGVLEMAQSALRALLATTEVARLSQQEQESLVARCYVFGDATGTKVANFKRAWETAILKAHGHTPKWAAGKKLTSKSREALAEIDLHFHDLRHEAGSRLLETGWPILHVQHMLGHENLSQTSTYLNATRVGLQESMRRFEIPGTALRPLTPPSENNRQVSVN
jgi:integrase